MKLGNVSGLLDLDRPVVALILDAYGVGLALTWCGRLVHLGYYLGADCLLRCAVAKSNTFSAMKRLLKVRMTRAALKRVLITKVK